MPKEVGPPPGGPLEVHSHIPVVFFTAKGIPGEVSEAPGDVEGALAACARALKFAGACPRRACCRALLSTFIIGAIHPHHSNVGRKHGLREPAGQAGHATRGTTV